MRGADGRAQFLTEVFPAELEELTRRRRAAESGQPELEPGQPDAERGLIGLALSGGGIRSATFGLGVVQATTWRLPASSTSSAWRPWCCAASC